MNIHTLLRHSLLWLLLLSTCSSYAEPVSNPFTILLGHAQKGNVDAMFEVGKYYEAGEYTEQNMKESVYWYQKAVDNNHVRAMLYLGRIYITGADALKIDISRGIQLIEQSANAGDAEAQFQLGQLFENGQALEQDLPSAIRWYRAAAQQKFPHADEAMQRCITTYKNRDTN